MAHPLFSLIFSSGVCFDFYTHGTKFGFTVLFSRAYHDRLSPRQLVRLDSMGLACRWQHIVSHIHSHFYSIDRSYGPTVVLCVLFVYVEIAVRLRDPKTFPLGIDICRPFAAHCVGYPAVTFGFVLKTMASHHLRQVSVPTFFHLCHP
ncbi:hypothetical protein AHF37_03604 [Paragonimus kellicotti]|nr:hypothetical protein AHF37_03604 [Paragonimus kellicotti]